MFKIGEILEIEIEKIVFGGEGLGYVNEMAVFVPMSAIGDRLEVKVISVKKNYARALIEKIIIPSEDRNNLEKVSFRDHSGCDFAMLKYEKQLDYKNIMLIDMMKKVAKVDIGSMYNGIIGTSNIKNYRNKVAEPFFIDNGKINTGFYERKSHEVFSTEDNLLKSLFAIDVTKKVLEKLNASNFSVYGDKKKSGFLKHLIIRNNQKGEVMLCIVTNGKRDFDKLKKILEEVYNENDNIVSVYISVKNRENNVILGDENILIFGNPIISEHIFDISFKIYLDSFFQINIEQVQKLYNEALSLITEKEAICIDAFSGTGTIAMLLAKKAKKVYAIESVRSAVTAAKRTAKENNIDNVRFVCSKVEDKISNILENEEVDYIVFDPPRKGIDKNVLLSVAKNNIKKLIYISCEPSTFARDLNILSEYGYRLNKISAVDMFPNTHHIEIVGLIEKER